MNKLLCNATLLFLGGTLLISNAQKPKFTYEYMITSNSNDINDMLVMYDVKQDFIKTYDELVLSLNEEYHRDTIINNLDKFIDSDLGKCEYLKNDGKCKAKEIELEFNGINTKYQGFKDVLICKTFKKSKEYEELENRINEILGDKE